MILNCVKMQFREFWTWGLGHNIATNSGSLCHPRLNFDATHIKELIYWELETITEPPLTYKLSTQDLIEVEAVKLKIKPYKVHTQSVERAVKLVTQASISVYGPEARDGFVKATVLSRRIMPKLNSKKDFAVMINKS